MKHNVAVYITKIGMFLIETLRKIKSVVLTIKQALEIFAEYIDKILGRLTNGYLKFAMS